MCVPLCRSEPLIEQLKSIADFVQVILSPILANRTSTGMGEPHWGKQLYILYTYFNDALFVLSIRKIPFQASVENPTFLTVLQFRETKEIGTDTA